LRKNEVSITRVLRRIPLNIWDEIIRREPEWVYMEEFLEPYGFGRFSVLMVMAGLNDFQLRGRAEVAYWPRLRAHLRGRAIPSNLMEMGDLFLEFYKKERLSRLKTRRVHRFMSSGLAERLWRSDPEGTAKDFLDIWRDLAMTMRQSKEAKTIVFAMKCLGISLLMAGNSSFSFEEIPIPVDFRIRNFSRRIGVYGDENIRGFWRRVLDGIREEKPINMIHLDSLIWQIGSLREAELLRYFRDLKLEDVGRELLEVIR